MTADLRHTIFSTLGGELFEAAVTMEKAGLVSGIADALQCLEQLECTLVTLCPDGAAVRAGERVLVFRGTARAIAMAEDRVIGCIAKPSGIARATAKAVAAAEGKVRIVAGAGKKMPQHFKPALRHAVRIGGAEACISPRPFIYLDKNYVRMFGSVTATLAGVAHMEGFVKVVQLRGEIESIADEARAAAAGGADVIMVDTGILPDLDAVSAALREAGLRERVSLAFAGVIRLDDIAEIRSHDMDILDIGQAIVDAPLADCRLDVLARIAEAGAANRTATGGLELNLLDKTEIRIHGMELDNVNLTELAARAAAVLGLPGDKVAVIDVRPGQVALDVLLPNVSAESFFGREKALLAEFASVPGVRLAPDASVHSRGILGAISLDEKDVEDALRNARAVSDSIRNNVEGAGRVRAIVFPTGFELEAKNIEDTNTPYLCKQFEQAGFVAEAGTCLPDRLADLVAALDAASASGGARVVVTTGGVGAEDKDFSVEAILALDPDAAAPYLVRFAVGHGRHVKDGIRIAVGVRNGCLLAALPGPHDEVRLVAGVLVEGVKRRKDKREIAAQIATILKSKFSNKTWDHHHGHGCGHHV